MIDVEAYRSSPNQPVSLELLALLKKRLKAKQKAYASSFVLDIAGNYFFNRALMIKGLVDDELTKQVKLQLFQYLLGDSALEMTMEALDTVFEPWVGDPTKVVPSGLSQTPEDILKPYRLETIVRTETATAMNLARKAVAEAADDFVLGYEHSSILDERTTLTCDLADGVKFPINHPKAGTLRAPLHFNCRSIDTYVTKIDEPVEWTDEDTLDKIIATIPKGWIK